ncbi:MAG: 3-isopropylmalate dehydrogenase [Flavobacteriaceae bacterium]|nr:3-isopropylmalate dehydrogenase [Flavobacteriaceae bacterium]
MIKKIAVLSGDGIGPEVTRQAIKILDAVAGKYGHKFEYREGLVGAIAIDQTGNPLPYETLDLCKNTDAILFGAIGTPKYDNDPNAIIRPEQGLLKLRKEMGLFANIRPLTTYKSLLGKSNLKEEVITGVDFIIYRELTGGIYFGEKKLSDDGNYAEDICGYSSEEIDRIIKLAFEFASKRDRKKLTLIDKANVLETSRLWRKRVRIMAEKFPEVAVSFLFVDNAAMQMILNPKQFDVIVTENMFGDIISDQASVISGSIGLLASASIGYKYSMFEPIHGSYPEASGMNIANPIASILSAAMMLEHFGLFIEAKVVREAVEVCIDKGILTPDLNKTNEFSTTSVGNFIAETILNPEENFFNKENINLGNSTII